MLFRRNIVIDAETAQLVAAAIQAAVQAGAPSRSRAGTHMFAPPVASRCSYNGSCSGRGPSGLPCGRPRADVIRHNPLIGRHRQAAAAFGCKAGIQVIWMIYSD